MAILKRPVRHLLAKPSLKSSVLKNTPSTLTTCSSHSVAPVPSITLWLFCVTVVTVFWSRDLVSPCANLFARILASSSTTTTWSPKKSGRLTLNTSSLKSSPTQRPSSSTTPLTLAALASPRSTSWKSFKSQMTTWFPSFPTKFTTASATTRRDLSTPLEIWPQKCQLSALVHSVRSTVCLDGAVAGQSSIITAATSIRCWTISVSTLWSCSTPIHWFNMPCPRFSERCLSLSSLTLRVSSRLPVMLLSLVFKALEASRPLRVQQLCIWWLVLTLLNLRISQTMWTSARNCCKSRTVWLSLVSVSSRRTSSGWSFAPSLKLSTNSVTDSKPSVMPTTTEKWFYYLFL